MQEQLRTDGQVAKRFLWLTTTRRVLSELLCWLCVSTLLVYAYARIGFGSVSNLSAYLRGHVLVTDRRVVDLSLVEPGRNYRAAFVVRDISSGAVVILGARVCCGCSLLSELPRRVRPNEDTTLEFTFHVPTEQPAGQIKHQVLLLIDKAGGYGPVLTMLARVGDSKRASEPGPP